MTLRNATMPLTRRTALRAGLAGGMLAALSTAPRSALAGPGTSANLLEAAAGGWRTWVLESGSDLRPVAPPGARTTRSELDTLRALAADRDASTLDQISYWDTGAPGYRWNEIAIAQGLKEGIAIAVYRVLALVNVAIYDATVAAWDAKYAYNRPRPSQADPSLDTALPTPSSPSYPSEHAAAAGAASAVLAFLFPNDAQSFMDQADMAANSRVAAGLHYPSDIAAGLELGRAVADKVIEWARTDGSDIPWTGPTPAGPGIWYGDPLLPGMGNWRTWVLESASEFGQVHLRPPTPPNARPKSRRSKTTRATPIHLKSSSSGQKIRRVALRLTRSLYRAISSCSTMRRCSTCYGSRSSATSSWSTASTAIPRVRRVPTRW